MLTGNEPTLTRSHYSQDFIRWLYEQLRRNRMFREAMMVVMKRYLKPCEALPEGMDGGLLSNRTPHTWIVQFRDKGTQKVVSAGCWPTGVAFMFADMVREMLTARGEPQTGAPLIPDAPDLFGVAWATMREKLEAALIADTALLSRVDNEAQRIANAERKRAPRVKIGSRIESVDTRIVSVDTRIASLDTRIAESTIRLITVEEKLSGLTTLMEDARQSLDVLESHLVQQSKVLGLLLQHFLGSAPEPPEGTAPSVPSDQKTG